MPRRYRREKPRLRRDAGTHVAERRHTGGVTAFLSFRKRRFSFCLFGVLGFFWFRFLGFLSYIGLVCVLAVMGNFVFLLVSGLVGCFYSVNKTYVVSLFPFVC